jgi:hypothetical protein
MPVTVSEDEDIRVDTPSAPRDEAGAASEAPAATKVAKGGKKASATPKKAPPKKATAEPASAPPAEDFAGL